MISSATVIQWATVGILPVVIVLSGLLIPVNKCLGFNLVFLKVFTDSLVLGLGFLHMLSDANDDFQQYQVQRKWKPLSAH